MAYNDNFKPTPDQFVKLISIIHLALLGGQLLFAIVAYAQAAKVFFGIMNTGDPLVYIVAIVAVFGFAASNVMFNVLLKAALAKPSLGEKIVNYQTALIARFALLEGPSLFAIVGFLLSGNLFFLIIAGLLMLYFLMLRPTKDKIDADLDLNFSESISFLNDNETIK